MTSDLSLRMMYHLKNIVRINLCFFITFSVFNNFSCIAVSTLVQPGTYAGNDAIVAFARNHQVRIIYILKHHMFY